MSLIIFWKSAEIGRCHLLRGAIIPNRPEHDFERNPLMSEEIEMCFSHTILELLLLDPAQAGSRETGFGGISRSPSSTPKRILAKFIRFLVNSNSIGSIKTSFRILALSWEGAHQI